MLGKIRRIDRRLMSKHKKKIIARNALWIPETSLARLKLPFINILLCITEMYFQCAH